MTLTNQNESRREVEIDGVLKRVQQHCLLVTLNVHCWQGCPQIEDAYVAYNEQELDTRVSTLPRWKLMPRSWQSKFHGLESKARTAIKTYSVPFSLRGVYIVPLVNAEELFTRLREIRELYIVLVDQFLEDYDSWIDDLKESLQEAFETVKGYIPPKQKLKYKFGIEWAIVPMGQPGNTVDDFSISDLVREAKQTMADMVMSSVETMVQQPRAELAEAIDNLVKIISKENRAALKGASLEKLYKAFQKYRSFASIIDTEGKLLNLLDNVENELEGVSTRQINRDESIRDGLLQVLGAVQTEVNMELNSKSSLDKFKRTIRLQEK